MIVNSQSQGQIQSVIDINIEKTVEYKEDIAEIQIANDDEAESLNPNETITIEDNGTVIYKGIFTDSKTENTPYSIISRGYLSITKNYNCNGRVFYEEPVSDVITQLINEDIIDKGKVFSNVGNITGNVSATLVGGDSSGFHFEQTDFVNINEEKIGNDTIFMGIDEKNGGTAKVDFDNIDYQGDDFKSVEFLGYFNTQGEFDISFEYRENDKNYKWNIDSNLNGYEKLELKKEEAKPEGNLTTNNKFRLILNTNGKIQKPTAIAIDGLGWQVVDTVQRDLDINIGDVTSSKDNRLIRKFNGSVYDALDKIQKTIPEKIIYNGKEIKTVSLGAELSSINNNSIISTEKKFDSNKIINVAKVTGRNVVSESKSKSSINFYDVKNTKNIRDESITSQIDAKRTAEQIVEDKAFVDTKLIIESVNENNYQNTQVGDKLEINGRTLNDNFVIHKVENKTNNKIIITAENN